MARAGLGSGWECGFANDFCAMKAATYRANWGDVIQLGDVNDVRAADLPGRADLAWASFPCQDLSLAGNVRGIGTATEQTRSGAFWAFWHIMQGLGREGRAPALVVLENVYGVLTANEGRDFAMIARCLSLEGYRFGAVVMDAVDFLPQSRPRVFIVAVRSSSSIPSRLVANERNARWHPPAMVRAIDRLAEIDQEQWFWLSPPPPPPRIRTLDSVIEDQPRGVEWHTTAATQKLIAMMNASSLVRLERMRAAPDRKIGTIYKRTRVDEAGKRVQRAELRDDQIAGCLRTPGGGSSRQTLMIVDNGEVRSRLLSAREAARLMGVPESYSLPARYNDAYRVAGDGVAVPVVRYLAKTVLEPILSLNRAPAMIAAE